MRDRFPLTSDQLELLLAFEAVDGSLGRLAEHLHRDSSVVSRNLQRLAEDAPVLVKRGTKWQITPLGRRINEMARRYSGELDAALASGKTAASEPFLSDAAVLMVINAQRALLDSSRGQRSNAGAEDNVRRLMHLWRETRRTIAHIKHVSRDKASAFHPSLATCEFLPDLAPLPGEWLVEKPAASAFSNPQLASELEARGVEALVLVGFTANECVDATAKQASDLGFKTYVVADATAMFDIVGPNGQVYSSGKTQDVLLASLHASFATVISTDAFLVPRP